MKNFEHVGRAVKEKKSTRTTLIFHSQNFKAFSLLLQIRRSLFFHWVEKYYARRIASKTAMYSKVICHKSQKRPHGGDNALPTFHVLNFALNKVGATVRASSTIACPIMESIES